MTKKELQLIAATTVIESKLPKDSKEQLLNFIQKEATEHQLMVLLMDGKISKISKITEAIVEDRFKIFERRIVVEGKGGPVKQGIAKCKKDKDFKGCMKKFFAKLRASK